MTKEEFMVEWCAKSGFDHSVFDTGERVAVPCYCGGGACKGWRSIQNNPERLREHFETDGVQS